MTELATVLDLVRRGWAVFPVGPDKKPLVKGGVYAATREEAQVRRWWSDQAPNPAVACGEPSGLWVLDVDGDEGKASLAELEREHGALPATLRVLTARGFHLYFPMPRSTTIKNAAGLRPGLDVRGSGGYVVAAGAQHSSGAVYRFSDPHAAVLEAPGWLLAMVAKTPLPPKKAPPPPSREVDPRARKVLKTSVERVRSAAPGGRNNTLNAAAHTCAGYGVPEELAREELLAAAVAAGLPLDEAERTWASGWSAGLARPVALDPLRVARTRAAPVAAAPLPANDSDESPPAAARPAVPLRLVYSSRPGEGEYQRGPDKKNADGEVTRGGIKPNLHNLFILARRHADVEGLFGYNELAQQVVLMREPPWEALAAGGVTRQYPTRATNNDLVFFTGHLQSISHTDWKTSLVGEALSAVSRYTSFDPLKDYLNGLRWDGVPRLDHWVVDHLGAAPLEIQKVYGRRWLIAAVARAFQPGVDVEGCLVLEDTTQGTGKSSALRVLATGSRVPSVSPQRSWFHDGKIKLDREGVMEMEGCFIWELAELAGMARAELEELKGFLTRPRDKLRRPYGRVLEELERRCVFAATTNRREYLRDEENRRWWPIATGLIRLDLLEAARDQLWAEAVVAFRAGEPWYLDTPELRALHAAHVGERREVDPWDARVADYCEGRDGITTAELFKMLDIDPKDRKRADEQRLGQILRVLGYTDRRLVRVGGGAREWRYFKPLLV